MAGSIDTWDALVAAQDSQRNPSVYVSKATSLVANTSARWLDSWAASGNGFDVGAVPTAAVVPTTATVGAVGQRDGTLQNSGGSLKNWLVAAELVPQFGATVATPGLWLLCDRLSHQGGLSGTTTGAQTTNLPTAALTRYTSGEGVMAGLSIYSQLGASGTTVTASYTNTASTAGQATQAVAIGATAFREVNRLILLPLASGDTGVKSVESVTLAASTGTAGNIGVVLFKPLAAFCTFPGIDELRAEPVLTGTMFGGLPEIVDDACLFWVRVAPSGGGGIDQIDGFITIAES